MFAHPPSMEKEVLFGSKSLQIAPPTMLRCRVGSSALLPKPPVVHLENAPRLTNIREALTLAIVAFASTNIDDAFVLVAFFSDSRLKSADVVVGQCVGIAALVAITLVLAQVALTIPEQYVGSLGVLPIWMGLKELWSQWRDRGSKVVWKKREAPGARFCR